MAGCPSIARGGIWHDCYDQLAIRCLHEPSGLPVSCDGCGAPFTLQHDLDCAGRVGGWGGVKEGHSDLRDSSGDKIAGVTWGGVAIEHILVPENDKKG